MAEITFDVQDGSDTVTKRFVLAPHIGHCIELQNRGIDLLGVSGESELAKLIASPVDFLHSLEVLIDDQAGDDDRFKMPALASFMTGGKWLEVRKEVLASFEDFFRANGYPQLAESVVNMQGVEQEVTQKVAESLKSGELKARIDQAVRDTVEELTAGD